MKAPEFLRLEIEAEGVVFLSPRPHVRAVHAWHPRLHAGAGARLFVTYDLAQAVESLDYRTYVSHSDDGGQSWSEPRRLYDDELLPSSPRRSTHLARQTRMRDGELVAVVGRYFRDDVDEGIINHTNTGLVDMELFLIRSGDDGRWLAPLMTWHGWNETPPYRDKAVAFISSDRGRSWSDHVTVMDGSGEGIYYYEQGLAQLDDGRVLALAWAFDSRSGTTRSIDWSIGGVEGFSPPERTALRGETAKLLALSGGGALCVYRGIEPPGLCGSLLGVTGGRLAANDPVVLWKGQPTHMSGSSSAGQELAELKLGSPHMIALDGERMLVVFWCCVDCVFHIRWIRARLR